MYKKIDELIEVICQDNTFKQYIASSHALYDQETMALLSRHQMLQNDYMNMKTYQKYVSNDDLKESLKEVKQEMSKNPKILQYYQDYHAFNDLLEAVTKLVFDDISNELSFDTWIL